LHDCVVTRINGLTIVLWWIIGFYD